jgi:peptidoglycan/xylan/chitin deacetylase (PgdA/CDA1 family)
MILAASFLFFHFHEIANPKDIADQLNNKKIENSQNVAPEKTQTISGDETEPQKMIPSAIPILMYHYIREYYNSNDPIGKNLSVAPEKFEEHLAWLKDNGYQSVFPNFFINPEPISFKPVILTFDDGYQDAYDNAFPILQKYQMAGMFYLIVNKVGTPGYLTWDEISEMQKAGMSFGSHTLTHPDLRNLAAAILEREIKESKEVLEQKLGQAITDFCYPSGKYNSGIIKVLEALGYQTAVTTESGIAGLKDNPFLLKRFRITENTDIQAIFKVTGISEKKL